MLEIRSKPTNTDAVLYYVFDTNQGRRRSIFYTSRSRAETSLKRITMGTAVGTMGKIRIHTSAVHRRHSFSEDDPASQPIYEWDGSQPWSQKLISPLEEDYIESLEKLYYKLKGRQKQIVKLLFEHETNVSEIARILGMKQPNVVRALRQIKEKLEKMI